MDEETRRFCIAYAGGDFDKPREITIEVFSEYGATEWTVDGFLSDIKEAVEAISLDKRAEAKVELSGGYDESTTLVISYRGMESDEVVQDRIARCIAYANDKIRGERATFEALKKKFEPQS